MAKRSKHQGGRPEKHTPEDCAKLAKELVEWAKLPDSCHLSSFTGLIHNKTKSWIYGLCEFSEPLAEALKTAKEIIAAKYTEKGLKNEWNANLVGRWTGVYDKEIQEYEKDKASWGKDKDQELSTQTAADEILAMIKEKK